MTTTAVQMVANITVTPPEESFPVHGQVTLHAVLTDAGGHVVRGAFVYWSSADSTIATVSSSGVVTGMSAGRVQIAASSDGRSGIATVTVSPVPVTSVTIVPATLKITVGSTGQLLATAYDGSGRVVSGLTVTWGSGTSAVATVDQTGKVTAVAVGTSTVTASVAGKTGSASVVVSSQVASVGIVPDTLRMAPTSTGRLTATAYDASGKVVSGLTTAWSSSNSSVATVDASGLVTGKGAGTATMSATIGGAVGVATVIVAVPPPVEIQGCNGGTLTETAAAAIIVVGNIDKQCHATITSTAGSIEVRGKVDHGSVVTLVATAGVTIDNQISGGSTVDATAGGPFSVGQGVGGGPGASALTVFDCTSLTVGGDVNRGTQAKLHSHGPIGIAGAVHDPDTKVLWWAPSFKADGGVSPPSDAVKQNWGGFPDQY